jgi:hypothetical protein
MKILDIPQSGKKGLDVSMNGRYGQVRRMLVIPTNPRTTSQITARANLAAAAKCWRGLTENGRKTWIAQASTTKSVSHLGQPNSPYPASQPAPEPELPRKRASLRQLPPE